VANSLADQLLKAGLVNAKKAQQVKKDKKKKQKQQFKNRDRSQDESKLAAQQALTEKQEKSRKLNQQREAEANATAVAAQIKQLIEYNVVKRDGDVPFNFVDAGKIKKIYVDNKMQNDLQKGNLAVVKFSKKYEVVPAGIAVKIAQRDDSYVLLANKKSQVTDEDDPYAEFKIPDDLMW